MARKQLIDQCLRCLLLVALAWPLAARADIVELFDGTRIETETVTYQDGQLVVDDGRAFPRNEVRRIIVGEATTSEAGRAPLMAGAEVKELLAQADAARERYPDVGAVTLVDDGNWTLRPDGTHVERYHSATLILKEPFKSLGAIQFAYEEGRERVNLVRARTISPTGEVHEFDPADLKEVKPTGGMLFFTEYKTVSGQLPQVEVGSIVETIWEKEVYDPYDEALFFPRWYFGGTEPSLHSRATVRVPQGQDLHYQVGHLPADQAAPKRWTEGEYDVYQWELEDIEHVVSEPGMPPVGEVVPHMAASPFADWDYIFDFLGKFQKKHTEVTPEIEAQVAEIVGDAADPEQKLERIYHWLQREVRYISIKGSLGSGWSGHPATLTLQNKYGDCIDKATLFATMLKAVGIKAEPVIVATYGLPEDDRELPTMYGNHAITEVHLNGRSFHLDCTGTSFRYPYFPMVDHGVSTINVLERKIGEVEVPPAEMNMIDANMKMRLKEDGTLQAIFKFSLNGSMEGFARAGLEQINQMLRKMVAEQMINSLSPGAKVVDLEISDESDLTVPLEIKLKIVMPEYPTFAGDLMIFEMPLGKLAKSAAVLTALDEREFDILVPSAMGLRQTVTLQLPDGYEPKGLPDDVAYSSPYASYEASFEYVDGAVVYTDKLTMDRRRVPASDYATFKQLMEDFTDFAKKPLFLYKPRS